MYSYNTHELSENDFIVRVYNQGTQIVVELEQDEGTVFITFNNEQQFKKYAFELASVFGKVVSR